MLGNSFYFLLRWPGWTEIRAKKMISSICVYYFEVFTTWFRFVVDDKSVESLVVFLKFGIFTFSFNAILPVVVVDRGVELPTCFPLIPEQMKTYGNLCWQIFNYKNPTHPIYVLSRKILSFWKRILKILKRLGKY